MSSDIFIINEDNELVPVRVGPFESEDRLQEWLARCPDLLSGGQMSPGAARRWLLLRREAGVPDAEAAADRWALDHLFLDQDGVPTLVEVKAGIGQPDPPGGRRADARLRRQRRRVLAGGAAPWLAERAGPWR